jgi:hypothetical protein
VPRRLASILLLLWFAALGAGLLEYVHNLQHEADDARAAALLARATSPAGQHAPAAPTHDDTNCPIHLQLHMPLLAAGWVPLLVCLGLFVAFLTLLAPRLISHRCPARIDCRGPPARLAHLVPTSA